MSKRFPRLVPVFFPDVQGQSRSIILNSRWATVGKLRIRNSWRIRTIVRKRNICITPTWVWRKNRHSTRTPASSASALARIKRAPTFWNCRIANTITRNWRTAVWKSRNLRPSEEIESRSWCSLSTLTTTEEALKIWMCQTPISKGTKMTINLSRWIWTRK